MSKPFGAVDTPEQGGTISGKKYINWGWCLTPMPSKIPVDGSTITVYVDGVALGNPVYNIYRADIAKAFPGYANSDGAVGYFYIDTTAYDDGVHAIQWVVTDNAGNSDGIGSRYFTISNDIPVSSSSAASASSASGSGVANSGKVLPPVLRNISKVKGLPVEVSTPVRLKTGFDRHRGSRVIGSDSADIYHVNIREFERMELELAPGDSYLTGGVLVGDTVRPLPVGSTLRDGTFYWSIGEGFYGKYELVFVITDRNGGMSKRTVTVTIGPKF